MRPSASPSRVTAVVLLLFLIAIGCSRALHPAGQEDDATAAPRTSPSAEGGLHLRATRQADLSETESASLAQAAFWDAFYAERYEAIPGIIRQLTAAFLENPHDPQTALLLAHTHLWKVSERNRAKVRDPTITDHLVLAEHYFEQAYRLRPDDHRIIGWLGSVRLALGAVRRDAGIAREGELLLAEGVRRYPEFNLFTSAFVRSGLPATDERFRGALEQLWRNVDACSGTRSDTAQPMARAYELAERADPSCANSTRAPHNFEGFVLNLGDMLVKAGEPVEAASVYARARLSPTYASWPYRLTLEERIRNAGDVARRASAGEAPPMMSGSAYSCAACHARH